MAAQGELRDRCRTALVRQPGQDDGSAQPWCLTHDQPAGHQLVVGDVGADPAARPLPSDGEEQYAGRTAGGHDTDRRARRARRAVDLTRAEHPDTRAEGARRLARLRAEHTAQAATGNTAQVLLTMATCADCGDDVARGVHTDTDSVTISAWVHLVRATEADHRVRTVRVDR